MNNEFKIYFIRHSKVDLPYKNHLEMPYEILDDLATSRIDPSIAKNSKELFLKATKNLSLENIDVIYFNNSNFQSKRSKESAFLISKFFKKKYKKDVLILGNPDLKEIDFSLKNILPKKIFLEKGMPAIRTALYNAIINHGPVEQTSHIYKRIENVFKSLKKHQDRNQNVLLVSHDFYMRLIEVYLQKSKNCKHIIMDDLEGTTLNTYFKGFCTSYDLKLFERF